MCKQFAAGERVVYGKMGVCLVTDRQVMAFGGESEEYYILQPQRDPRSSIYVPCGNALLMAKLRPLLSKEEIDTILQGVPQEDIGWIDDKNERSTQFRRILAQDDRRQLLRLIRCLMSEKRRRIAAGKKLPAADEATLQEGVHLVEQEFSQVLNIPAAQVNEYIRARIEEAAAQPE